MKTLIIGAHPDDPEVMLGGLAQKLVSRGYPVTLVSMTDGRAGHHEMPAEALVQRRAKEARRAAEALGVQCEILPFHDAELIPSIENRNELIRFLRRQRPDLIFTHPMMDYHPDHRYTCQLLMDTSYLVNVPAVASEVPVSRCPPAFFFSVTRPVEGAFAFGIDRQLEGKLDALNCHESQMFEWLPWASNRSHEVPADPAERRRWLSEWRAERPLAIANAFRAQLGEGVRMAEAIAPAPVGRRLTEMEWKELKEVLQNE